MSVGSRNILGAVILLLLFAGASRAQERVIVWSAHPIGSLPASSQPPLQLLKQIDAIEVTEIEVEGTSVIIGQPFQASTDWLKNIKFKVKNNSDKVITYVQISLTLPQIKGHRQVRYTIDGRGLNANTKITAGGMAELHIPPGGEYDWIKSVVAEEKLDFSTIGQAEVYSVFVFFEDGTQLNSGCVKTLNVWHPCPHS